MSKTFEKHGAFFAFNDKQLDEEKRDGVKYMSLGGGMICPEINAKQLTDDLDEVIKAGIKQDIEENGEKRIIVRELANHEANYTGDITSTGYGFTRDSIINTFQEGL